MFFSILEGGALAMMLSDESERFPSYCKMLISLEMPCTIFDFVF